MIRRILGRLVRRDDCIVRVESGVPMLLLLCRYKDIETRPTTAAVALARRGVPMRLAKVAVAAASRDGGYPLTVPMVENINDLTSELNAAGIEAVPVWGQRGI